MEDILIYFKFLLRGDFKSEIYFAILQKKSIDKYVIEKIHFMKYKIKGNKYVRENNYI